MGDALSVRQMHVSQASGLGLFSLVEGRKTSLVTKGFKSKEELLELCVPFDEL